MVIITILKNYPLGVNKIIVLKLTVLEHLRWV